MQTQTIEDANRGSASRGSTGEDEFDEGKLERPMTRAALDDARRELVKDNIGLVYVHMKHYVTPHHIPWTQREWEDLVQEGCLGLIRAAQDFDPKGQIPFAAFALPRIHTAIRRVILQRFGGGTAFAGGAPLAKGSLFGQPQRPDWSPRRPRRDAGLECPLERLGDWWGANNDTVGVRLREKYERAVARAVANVAQENEGDAQAHALTQAVATDRHLVPDGHDRKTYREIARRMGAPYTRVLQIDRRLQWEIRRGLENDPEFAHLTRLAASEPKGVDTPAGDALDQQLARLAAAEILQRLLRGERESRQRLMDRLFRVAPASLLESIRRALETLPADFREQLLAESCLPPAEPAHLAADPIQEPNGSSPGVVTNS